MWSRKNILTAMYSPQPLARAPHTLAVAPCPTSLSRSYADASAGYLHGAKRMVAACVINTHGCAWSQCISGLFISRSHTVEPCHAPEASSAHFSVSDVQVGHTTSAPTTVDASSSSCKNPFVSSMFSRQFNLLAEHRSGTAAQRCLLVRLTADLHTCAG